MRTRFSLPYRTELRKKIMQSAMENFSKKGFDRTRMEDIAAPLKGRSEDGIINSNLSRIASNVLCILRDEV